MINRDSTVHEVLVLVAAISVSLCDLDPFNGNLKSGVGSLLNALLSCRRVPGADQFLLIQALMNFPITLFHDAWFLAEDYSIVADSVKLLEETIMVILPNNGVSDTLSHSMMFQGNPVDHAFPPLLVLLKNFAIEDLRARKILQELIMPVDM